MPSDYEKIQVENIKKYGECTHHLEFFGGQMYTDRTHFIFEMLQNAEDAGATKIHFKLSKGLLQISHDGVPFSKADVEAICGIGDSLKAKDQTKIGKFGIGFKSVYAYTSRPEIHSNNEHFCIESFIRPSAVKPISFNPDWTTVFYFPLGNQEVDAEEATDEISVGLKNLSLRTLLFLRNIETIYLKVGNDPVRTFSRSTDSREYGRLVTISVIGTTEKEKWLIFDKKVIPPESKQSVYVEVGFQISSDKDGNNEVIVAAKNTELVVFFPTEKETHLGFLIQGPYVTTPPRDNVLRKNQWNAYLVKETAKLLVESLLNLKKMDLLTVSVLKTLPIRTQEFTEDSMFYPIAEAVKNAFKEHELLPTNDDSFASASNAKLAGSNRLRMLVDPKQLGELFGTGERISWLIDKITVNLAGDLFSYLKSELGIDEVEPEQFIRLLTKDFLTKQSDRWIIKFYKFADERIPHNFVNWQSTDLLSLPIVRLQDGSHVVPFDEDDSPNAYLVDKLEVETTLATVKYEIFQDVDSRSFLERIKIPKLNVVDELIDKIRKKYLESDLEISIGEHLDDISAILTVYQTGTNERKQHLVSNLAEIPFVMANEDNDEYPIFYTPNALYLATEELKIYFEKNNEVQLVSSAYPDPLIFELLRELEVKENVCVELPDSCSVDDGLNLTINGFHPKLMAEGLEHAISTITNEKAEYIWNKIALPNKQGIFGKSGSNPRINQNEIKGEYSDFGSILENSNWVPFKNGKFKKPKELKISELPESFEKDVQLANQLGMLQDEVANFLSTYNLSASDIEFIESHRDEFQEFKNSILKTEIESEFPIQSVSDPERRKIMLQNQFEKAMPKTYEIKSRSERTSKNSIAAKERLRILYTNDEDIMFCQICKKEMPFRKPNGDYYFEETAVLSKIYTYKEIEPQYLALCPLCAAMYKVFIISYDEEMEAIKQDILNAESLKVPLTLGELNTSIRFVESHLFDLQNILEMYD